MAKQPTTGQKKTKEQIAKAASQKKSARKVIAFLQPRNGPRARSKRNPTMQSSSTQSTTPRSPANLVEWANSSQSPLWWTDSKLVGTHCIIM